MKNDRRIIQLCVLMGLLFLSICVYLTLFVLFPPEEVQNSPYDTRQWELEQRQERGRFLDRNGEVLADNAEDGTRVYPKGGLYTHVLGYSSRTYGRVLLEANYNNQLLNLQSGNLTDVITMLSTERRGADITLTIDHDLQAYAASRLGNQHGAVVALDPKTGEVLALYSNPTFDPNLDALTKNFSALAEDEKNAPFVARAINGNYAPGSTFKVIVAAAALKAGMEDFTFSDTEEEVSFDGTKIRNYGGKTYGELDLKSAFVKSSNTAFASLGEQLGYEEILKMAEAFGFNETLKFDLTVTDSKAPRSVKGVGKLAQTSIGQGDLLATPLQMATVASTIANNGQRMQPYLVSDITYPNGFHVKTNSKSKGYAVSESVAQTLQDWMKAVVTEGTGTAARASVGIAGKTGTAQNERADADHAWFIGYAPAEEPNIAVCVLLEYAGRTGGDAAAPIARDILVRWQRLRKN